MKIENGFVIGTAWPGDKGCKTIMVPVNAIEKIILDAGNSPKADRIYLREARAGHIDLMCDADQ